MGASNNSPGAGTYQLPSMISEGPKFVIGSRLPTDMSPGVKHNPGPGQYDLQNRDNVTMHSPRKFSMGSSQRGNFVAKSVAPGPGNYATSFANKTQSPRFGFGSGSRSEMTKTTSFPGPG